ncbi:MAG: HAMP domain-containing histidine kinase [Muribaculaceae bacterium]|nr:HAMP domain-containing histidine kinase [Muribaculaceae bacterium]
MRLGSFYDRQRAGKLIFIMVSVVAIVIFLVISNTLVKSLAAQERERMNVWAQATEKLARADVDTDVEFLLSIISQNTSIPVMVADSAFNIIDYRNYHLPDKADTVGTPVPFLSERNYRYLSERLKGPAAGVTLEELAQTNPHFIKVEALSASQYIYYEDSILLKRLSFYPYVQLAVMIVLAVIIYAALIYTKRAEQNRVWVGLSKETAHQLGTPISSLMAWSQYLEGTGAEKEVTDEINKDVRRLSVIADRFSKIGSKPELNLEYLNEVVEQSLQYMKGRISDKVELTMRFPQDDYGVAVSRALFEWVMENLTKNAVDAMDGSGRLEISTGVDKGKAFIDIKDTGKGIQRKNFKTVFHPGYTTKKRGWGLGLTLVKRIIEEYHGGRIYVKESEVGRGTTFRIELPLVN